VWRGVDVRQAGDLRARLLTGGDAVANAASACDLDDPQVTEAYPFDVLVGKATVAHEYGLSLNLYCPCSLRLFESYL
jgi:hypothetical protein